MSATWCTKCDARPKRRQRLDGMTQPRHLGRVVLAVTGDIALVSPLTASGHCLNNSEEAVPHAAPEVPFEDAQ